MSQAEMILAYIEKYGSITQAEAIAHFGCYRLGARIYDLKRKGHKIIKIMESSMNRFGKTTSYARYKLSKQAA